MNENLNLDKNVGFISRKTGAYLINKMISLRQKRGQKKT